MRRRHRLLPSLSIGGLLLLCSILLSHSPAEGTTLSAKRIILDTDLYSDVDDAGALLLLLTEPPHVETLAVCLSHPSRYSALAAAGMIDYYASSSARKPIPLGLPLQRHSLRSECCGRLTNESFFDQYYFRFGEYASKVAYGWARRSPTTAEISPPSPVASSDDAGSSLGWDDVAPEGTVRDGGMHWGNAVDVYRRVLAHVLREAEESGRLDESSWKVTVVVIGFLDNVCDDRSSSAFCRHKDVVPVSRT